MVLPLSMIPGEAAVCCLEEMRSRFHATETLSGENAWLCPCCNKKGLSASTCVVEKWPPVLFLMIRRWNQNGEFHGRHVACPAHLANKDGPSLKLVGAASFWDARNHYTVSVCRGDTVYNVDDAKVTRTRRLKTENSYVLCHSVLVFLVTLVVH